MYSLLIMAAITVGSPGQTFGGCGTSYPLWEYPTGIYPPTVYTGPDFRGMGSINVDIGNFYYFREGDWTGFGNGSKYANPFVTLPVDPPAKDGKMETLPIPKAVPPAGKLSRAKMVIDVPAQAMLYIDGQRMPNIPGQRTFITPELQAGRTYYYEVKIVQIQDGREVAQTTQVTLRPGQVVAATFNPTNTSGVTVVTSRQ